MPPPFIEFDSLKKALSTVIGASHFVVMGVIKRQLDYVALKAMPSMINRPAAEAK